MLLARDSQRTDRIAAENLAQHAEHYYRVANANNALSNGADRGGSQGQSNGADQGEDGEEGRQSRPAEANGQSPESESQDAVVEAVSPPPVQAGSEAAESRNQSAPNESKPRRRRSSGRPRKTDSDTEPTGDNEPVQA